MSNIKPRYRSRPYRDATQSPAQQGELVEILARATRNMMSPASRGTIAANALEMRRLRQEVRALRGTLRRLELFLTLDRG